MALVSLNPTGGVAPAPGEHVLKAADYAAVVEAGRVVEEARLRTGEILRQAEKDAEERRRQGFLQGVREGKDEVAGQFFEAMSASVEQLAGMESSLVDVVVKSLRTILGSFDREELATRVVGHALRLVRDEKRVLLRVSPEDQAAVEARLDDIVARYPGMLRVDVQADAAVGSGGCVIETELGVIDATLDRQLAIMEETFKRQIEGRKS